jgi:hypothetical protein
MSTKPEEVDFLTEDDEIRGQRYVLLSFISPEKVLADKDVFFFNEFVKDYEVSWKTKNLEKFLAEQILGIRKTLLEEADKLEALDLSGAALKVRDTMKQFNTEDAINSYKAFVSKNKKEINTTKINADYDEFLYNNQERLEDAFYAKNEFKTSIRGLKVRGVYANDGEAQARAKKLQQKDPRHNILIGDVGKWLAWDPAPHQIPNQEYANEELNKLMKKYNENEDALDKFYQENPAAKGKTVKSVFNMAIEPSEDTSVVEVKNALFDGPADLAIARKMEATSLVHDETKSTNID